MTFPSANSKSASPTRSCASSVRRHPSAARWRISQSPLGSTRRNVLSPCVPFGIGSRLHVHAVRVQVRGVRTVRHVRGAGEAARVHECGGNVVQELVEVLEHPRRRRGAVAPLGLRNGTKSGTEIVRRNLERVRRWPFRHLPVIRAEHVSQLHAQNGITPRANRRTRTGAVEAEERREPVARRDRPRDVPVSNDLQRQRLARPLLRTPYPRLRPVLDAHCRWIRERIRRRRLRRRAVPVPIRASAGLRSRASSGTAPTAASPAPICSSSRRASRRGSPALSSCFI